MKQSEKILFKNSPLLLHLFFIPPALQGSAALVGSILSSFNIFSWGKVQTAAPSGVVSPMFLEEFKQNTKGHWVLML